MINIDFLILPFFLKEEVVNQDMKSTLKIDYSTFNCPQFDVAFIAKLHYLILGRS